MSSLSKKQRTECVELFTNNNKDKKQCLHLMLQIQETEMVIKASIPQSICQEIAEYSTGFMIECPGRWPTWLKNLNDTFVCDGYIHYLYGDNCIRNDNKCDSDKFELFDYKCDSDKCDNNFHVFECSDPFCKGISVVIENGSRDVFPNRVCSNLKCGNIYCSTHYQYNGQVCEYCSKYFCDNCLDGLYCNSNDCSKYFCSNCMDYDIMNEDDDIMNEDWVMYCPTCDNNNNNILS